MTCSTCLHWSPKQSGQMAKHRMAICLKGPRWQFFPPQHVCGKHQAVAPDVAAVRVQWLNKGKSDV
jgi:hypothetical protein